MYTENVDVKEAFRSNIFILRKLHVEFAATRGPTHIGDSTCTFLWEEQALRGRGAV